ncbi:MAG: flagellar motor protein MotB [Phycisphaerae bacterium]
MARKAEDKAPEGAPDWMVTYGDMMTLLLCFFVLLLAMSEIKKDERFRQVASSIRSAFGYDSTVEIAPGDVDPVNSIVRQLQTIIVPPYKNQEGDAEDVGIEGRVQKITDVRDGIEIVVGGRVTFDRFSAVLKPVAQERLAQVAELIRGKNTKIIVRGHATRQPLPAESLFADPLELSFARAKAVAWALEQHGVRGQRIRLEAVGDREPLNRQAYSDERRAINRRVEIIVTESLLEDYAGRPAVDEN